MGELRADQFLGAFALVLHWNEWVPSDSMLIVEQFSLAVSK
jgi:hypothetical protein